MIWSVLLAFALGVCAGYLLASGPTPAVDPVVVGRWFGFDWHEFLRVVDTARQGGVQ